MLNKAASAKLALARRMIATAAKMIADMAEHDREGFVNSLALLADAEGLVMEAHGITAGELSSRARCLASLREILSK